MKVPAAIHWLVAVMLLFSDTHRSAASISTSNWPLKNGANRHHPLIYFSLDNSMTNYGLGGLNPTYENFTNILVWIRSDTNLQAIFEGINFDDPGNDNQAANYNLWRNESFLFSAAVPMAHAQHLLVSVWSPIDMPRFEVNDARLSYPTNFETFIRNCIDAGVDELKWDNCDTEAPFGEKNQRILVEKFRAYAERYADLQSKTVLTSIRAFEDNVDTNFAPWMAAFTHWNVTPAIGGYGNIDLWSNFPVYFDLGVCGLNYEGNGHYPFYSNLGNFHGNTNNLIGTLSMLSVAPFRFFIYSTNCWTNTSYSVLTNPYWNRILKDDAGTTAWRLWRNENDGHMDEGYARNLSHGGKVIGAMNAVGNSDVTNTITSTQLGWRRGKRFWALDCWNQTNFIATGSLTIITASNSGSLWLLTP